jgi:autotransporter passenger strand-loop-strand repeat protein
VTVDSGGTLVVLPGSTVAENALPGGHVISTGVVVVSSGLLTVSGAPLLTSATIGAFMGAYVMSGGVESGAVITGGGGETVFSGGVTISGAIQRFGAETILSGGVASATFVGLTGGFDVAGGTAYNVDDYGYAAVGVAGGAAGGYAYGTIVEAGAFNSLWQNAVVSGTTVFGTQNVCAGAVASGTLVQGGGTETVYSGGKDQNTLVLGGAEVVEAGGLANLTTVGAGAHQYVYGTASATLVSAGGFEVIANGGTEVGLTVLSGGRIDLTGLAYVATASTASLVGGVLTVTEGANQQVLTLAGTYTGLRFTAGPETGGTGTLLQLGSVACFSLGTRVLTRRGEVAVERLRIGDEAITADGAARPVRWIGHRRIVIGRHAAPASDPRRRPCLRRRCAQSRFVAVA